MIYVFLGPSLPLADARAAFDAEYLPPCAAGDVQALLERDPLPDAIAIIDGYFHSRPSVFHKEILYALSRGVPVLGASSMGALRAAECAAFGMIGVGAVFEAFRSGELEDDDEVTVAHRAADAAHAPVSDAMVNVRLGLAQACEVNVISTATKATLIEIAKETFYVERTWRKLLLDGKARGISPNELEALGAFVRENKPDQKRADALLLLDRLADVPRHVPSFEFAKTHRWTTLRTVVRAAQRFGTLPSAPITTGALVTHARIFADPDHTLRREALFGALLEEAAEARGIEPARVQRSMERQGLLDEHIAPVLQQRGLREQVLSETTAKWEKLAELGLPREQIDPSSVDHAELLRWLNAKTGASFPSLEDAARDTGLDRRVFVVEVLAAHVADANDRETWPGDL